MQTKTTNKQTQTNSRTQTNRQPQTINKRDVTTKFEVRSLQENPDNFVVEGYFALYENETELYDGIYEIITKGAFDKTLGNDIRALWNHNTQYVLGRNKSGTLDLRIDDKGLFGVVNLPNTAYANDVFELIQRGD